MTKIIANIPITEPPTWAVWERRLLKAMNQSVYPFLDHFTRDDGEFIWKDEWGGGSPDDFLEPFFNWPLVYLMGGGEHLLELADRHWEAVIKQLTRLGTYHKEYGFSEDQMHQAEADVCFYHLCLADPERSKRRERAQRFAGFFLNEDPDAINYDTEHKIIMSGQNGSKGAYYEPESDREGKSYAPVGGTMERYSLPFFDLPGITSVQDLADPEKARAMGQALFDRWRQGDTVTNLSITSVVTNAFLLTGEEKYREWVVEYTDAWVDRARKNGGLIPDNVGLSGEVGEYTGGKWYGGRYGWTFPHGFLTMQYAILDAAANAYLLTRDSDYLELPRTQMDRVLELGETKDIRDYDMSVSERWDGQFESTGDQTETFLVPYRYGDAGWFDWQPMGSVYMATLWNLSMDKGDWERMERVRAAEAHDWNAVFAFHSKEDSGHEQPWVRFLAGENPDYPERILHASHQLVCRRLEQNRVDESVGTRHHVHHWQWANPVSSEALIQLTLGAPQPIYNGGLLHARLRYFDPVRRRPGLPEEVGALVESLEADRTVVRLANLSPFEDQKVVIQAGAFGEHRFGEAKFQVRTSEFPGDLGGYAGTYYLPTLETEERTEAVNDGRLEVVLPRWSEVRLDLETSRYVNDPSAGGPW